MINERRVILEKIRKKTIQFELSMTEKYQLQILIIDQKDKYQLGQ